MSAPRSAQRLVRLYPRAWRARYGDELEALIVATSGENGVTWRARADVTRAAIRQHARRLAPCGAPLERARAGLVLALWAWLVFVCAGVAVQKGSEHWQESVAGSARGLPSAAFGALVAGAAGGGAIVLAGIAVLLPSISRLVRSGRVRELHAPLLRATAATGLALACGLGTVAWAHQLTPAQRDGRDAAYAAAFSAFVILAALCLACWVAAAGAVLGKLELSARVVRWEAVIATALAGAMVAMASATLVWWLTASAAPRPLADGGGDAREFSGSPLLIAAALTAMAIAVVLGGVGARATVASSRQLPPDRLPDAGA